MGTLILQWDNTPVVNSPNAIAQRISKRIKTVGGAFLTTGFTPANDLPKISNSVAADVTDNKVYEFKTQAICTLSGPTDNGNGIIEGIKFVCLVPAFQKTSATVTVIFDVTATDVSKMRVFLKRQSDNTTAGILTQARIVDTITANFSALTPGEGYYVEFEMYAVVNGVEVVQGTLNPNASVCGGNLTQFRVTTNGAPNYIWIADAKVCEKGGGFGVVKEIDGLSSPLRTWYDITTNRVYVADSDDAAGNVYWFNPDTALVAGDMVHSSAIIDPLLYNSYIDGVKRKIYFVGANTGGLKVYDIDTDTISTVAFGTNGAFKRTLLTVTADSIYCNDGTTSIVIIDRNTLAVTDTVAIAGIPTPSHFTSGALGLLEINGEMYSFTNNGSNPKIGVYNMALDTLIDEITLPGAATWDFGAYWQGGFFDVTSQQLYVTDIGSSRLYIIDVSTKAIIFTRHYVNREGKSNVQINALVNPINNDLYLSYAALNSSADSSPIRRVYLQDRNTHLHKNMYEGQFYIDIAGIAGTNNVIGPSPAATSWSGLPGYDTDGIITIFSSSVGSENTGNEIITTLKEVDANNSNAPSGNTKPNTIGDPNYLEPIEDSPNCIVPVTLTCPADKASTFDAGTLHYEFAVLSSVRNNPNILKIRVYAYDTDASANEGAPVVFAAPFNTNYFGGDIAGLTETNYDIRIQYLGVADAVLQDCLP